MATQAGESWDTTVAPAIPIGEDAVVTLLLSVADDDAYSAVYAHKTSTSPGVCLYETDDWLSDLWCADSGLVVAAGEEGVLHQGPCDSAKGWKTDQTPFEAMLTAVWSDETESIYIAAENAIGRRAGGKWSRVLDSAPSAFDVIRGTRDGSRVYAAGRRGVLAAQRGAGWTVVDSGTNMDLNGMFVTDEDEVWIAGDGGVVIRGVRDAWDCRTVSDVDFKDIAIFDGRIYLGAQEGLFSVIDGSVRLLKEIEALRLRVSGHRLAAAGALTYHVLKNGRWSERTYRVS